MAFFDKMTNAYFSLMKVPFRDFNPKNHAVSRFSALRFCKHLLIVIGFLLIEMSPKIVDGEKVDYWPYISFYLFDIAFFFVLFYWYFPYVLALFRNPGYRLLAGIGAIFTFGMLVHLYDSMLRYLKTGVFDFILTGSSFFLGAARGMLISLIAYLLANNKYVQEVEAENQKSRTRELVLSNDLLRAQQDPHLINNVLTVLYSRIIAYSKEDAEIIKLLSGLTSHAITQSDRNGYVDLLSEVSNIENYIRIMELCKEKEYIVRWNVDEEKMKGITVLPKILLEPVVNLLKYGSNSEEKPFEIELLITQGEELSFRTFNYMAERHSFGYHSSHTVGLANLRERLLINYPEAHTLDIWETESTFELTLKLKL